MQEKISKVMDHAEAHVPGFFIHGRMAALEEVFAAMDADGELTLDVHEMGPFYKYAFDSLFGVNARIKPLTFFFPVDDPFLQLGVLWYDPFCTPCRSI